MKPRRPVVITLEEQRPAICEACGRTAEVRPYGPGGIQVCFDCGMLDEETAKMRFRRRLGSPEVN